MCMPSIQNYILGLLQTVILAKRKRKEKIITIEGDDRKEKVPEDCAEHRVRK